MSGLCLVTAGVLAAVLPVAEFTLGWTHSVERVEWREDWRVEPDALVLMGFRVRGFGAGMEPGPGAVHEEGWWVDRSPGLRRVPSLTLAASAYTDDYLLCRIGGCSRLRTLVPPIHDGEPVTLRPCQGQPPAAPG